MEATSTNCKDNFKLAEYPSEKNTDEIHGTHGGQRIKSCAAADPQTHQIGVLCNIELSFARHVSMGASHSNEAGGTPCLYVD